MDIDLVLLAMLGLPLAFVVVQVLACAKVSAHSVSLPSTA